MKEAILFANVTMKFERPSQEPLVALDDLTLHIAPGQVFGLLGPNGSGKTTSVNLICGLLRPSAGRVQVQGVDVGDNVTQVRQALGVVPQETALYNDLTALENLRFHARLYKVPAAERHARIAEVLALVGLAERQHDRVGTYSGGMQRRLALARALLTRPAVVVLDEPTLGVDVQSRAAIWKHIRQIAAAGKTVLLTTNYMEEAQALADYLAILDQGKLIAQGTPDDLRQKAGETTVDIQLPREPQNWQQLKQIAGVTGVAWHSPHLRLTTAQSDELFFALLDYLRRQDLTPSHMTMVQPDLNDVFLSLTGQALRD